MSVSASSTSSRALGVNVLADAGQLLQELEVGASLVNVLFTMHDIDNSITAQEKNKARFELSSRIRWGSSPWASGMRMVESGKAVDEEKFIQDQAQRLYSALNGVSRSLVPSQTELSMGIEDIYVDESLLCTLALAIMEQAAMDDHEAALAMESGRLLPAVTGCQIVVQDERFFGLLGEEDGPGANTESTS
ncbi:hypothetical protein MD484_g4031, partial [Candolleomyces efflorescens]